MSWVNSTITEVLRDLKTDFEAGLDPTEAAARIEQYGSNEFEQAKKESLLKKIIRHLTEITAIILMFAAGIAAYMAFDGRPGALAKVIVIMSIVIINTILGVYQESKAEAALEALKKLNAHQTTVIRGGTKQKIDAAGLVPGDIVELNVGDIITADMRLLETHGLQVEESALTGESQPVEKDAFAVITDVVPLGDRFNMAYSGCLVTNGRALACVVETGMKTEMGKIAGLLNNTKKQKTPLQHRIHGLAKKICFTAIMAGLVIFLVGFFVHGIRDTMDLLLTGVAVGVAAVPETLPIIVTIILSSGVYSMVKKNTIIRQIPAVETVGNTSVICSDKTGTLTQNKMEIQCVWHVNSTPTAAKDEFNNDEAHLLVLMAACCNATIEMEAGKEKLLGDPTELAIIRLLQNKRETDDLTAHDLPRVHELPFDSGRKRMTTIHQTVDGYIAITKGAFDRIPVKWDEKAFEEAARVHDLFAGEALRVIAVGYKTYKQMPKDLSEDAIECDLKFLGMVGMIDPPRPESKIAVAQAKEAGIKTVMITGDHVMTAVAIAKEIGIFEDGDRAVTGMELAEMSDEDLFEQVRGISVYARVSPEDKIRIVQAWQAHNEVIAMTGDGVNDAPALKAADVGAAMGITGTEVSKNAADMVITDDNFKTIVDAVGEGRLSYDNIRKLVYFLLSVNFAEIAAMVLGMVVFARTPITALQILFINVIADGIPGFFLNFERPERGLMQRPPLSKHTGLFGAGLGYKVAQRTVTFTILTLTAYVIGTYVPLAGMESSYQIGRSMAFVTLSWASVINIFNIRSSKSIFAVGFLSNKGVFFSALLSMGITAAVAFVPVFMGVFDVVAISSTHWLIIAGLASLQLFSVEIQKLIQHIAAKRKGASLPQGV